MRGTGFLMKSMTGYGTAEGKVGKGRLYIEIKSVNHRFSEINTKIPGRMGVLESRIRDQLKPNFSRGKVDIFFKEKESLFGGSNIRIDLATAKKYKNSIAKLRRELGLKGEYDFMDLIGLDKILKVEESTGSYGRLWSQVSKLLKQAATQAMKMREKEGQHIFKDQKLRLKRIAALVKRVKTLSVKAQQRNLTRLRKKVVVNGGGVGDEQRLQAEVAYLGGRQDIAEELVRLESHIKQYGDFIKTKGAIGRRVDFLIQEMNREINTIGAKASDARISQIVVNCKAELERLKEQIQNVE
jgi:uncharacterized protein (TIGR00255 family)